MKLETYMKKEICLCSCHNNPLVYHFYKCCENSGKVYLNDDGTLNQKEYDKLFPEKESICPCCGGTGKAHAT